MILTYFVLGVVALPLVDAMAWCKVKLKPIGCFQDFRNDRALPEQLINERDTLSHVFNGKLINWKDPHYLPSFICRCASLAKKRGYGYFGIQFYGECWSGRYSHRLYHKHGSSNNCKKNWVYNSQCDVKTGADNANYVYKIIDRQCETAFSPVGCFHDNQMKPRPVPNYPMNERDKTITNWNGHEVEWERWNFYLPQLICRCAQMAKDIGDDIFAIQFYGECWTGSTGKSNYQRDGPSTKCIGENFKPCNCTDYHCAGVQKTNFVYKLSHSSGNFPLKRQIHRREYHHYYDVPQYADNQFYYNYDRKYEYQDYIV